MTTSVDLTRVAREIREEYLRCRADPSRVLRGTLPELLATVRIRSVLEPDRNFIFEYYREPARGRLTIGHNSDVLLSVEIDTDLDLELRCGANTFDFDGKTLPFVISTSSARYLDISIKPKNRFFADNEVRAKITTCYPQYDLFTVLDLEHCIFCETTDQRLSRLFHRGYSSPVVEAENPTLDAVQRVIRRSSVFLCEPRKLLSDDPYIDWTAFQLFGTCYSPDLCELARSKSTEFGTFARKNRLLARRVQQWLD